MFSLCIPTMDRYDFLSSYLFVYLENELIQEIIITDENGRDIEKIKAHFDHPKLKLFQNEKQLGPLLNKLRAASFAQNEWIALIDSDNFASDDYFRTAKKYIESNVTTQNVILAPSFAKPHFDYSQFNGFVFTKGTFEENRRKERKLNLSSLILMNTGNYVLHCNLLTGLDLSKDLDVYKTSACDVLYLNLFLFEHSDLHLHVVKGLEYDHIVHNDCVSIQTSNHYNSFKQEISERYHNFI